MASNGRRFLAALEMAFYSCSKRRGCDWGKLFAAACVECRVTKCRLWMMSFRSFTAQSKNTAVPSSDALNVLHLFATAKLKRSFVLMTCAMWDDMWHVSRHDDMIWHLQPLKTWITRISGSLKFSTFHAMAVPVMLSAPLDLPLHGCMGNAFRTGKHWSRHILCYPQKFTWETGRQGRLLFQRLQKINKTGQDWEKCVII